MFTRLAIVLALVAAVSSPHTVVAGADFVHGPLDVSGGSQDEDAAGLPSIETGDSGHAGSDAADRTTPINPLVPLLVFSAGLSILMVHAARASASQTTDDREKTRLSRDA